MTSAYTVDGVNVPEGDLFSKFAGDICRASYNNSPFVEVHDLSKGHFRGPRSFTFTNIPEGCTMDAAPDGIGSKVILIDSALSHSQAARDLIAMTAEDISRWGGMPLIFVNVLDVSTLGSSNATSQEAAAINQRLRLLMMGMGEVCREQGIVVFKGETAELGPCVGPEDPASVTKFNWAGVMIGVYDPRRMITGDDLAPGQIIVALKENGFRSNGISSVRAAFQKRFGADWRRSARTDLIHDAAIPSVLYNRFLSDVNGWFSPDFHFKPKVNMHLVVHVTGGAIRSKFAEDILFPRGLSADLPDLWDPPSIMQSCANWRGMTDEECYETWNGGQGILGVIDEKDFPWLEMIAKYYGILLKISGKIVKRDHPSVTIRSKFGRNKKEVVYEK